MYRLNKMVKEKSLIIILLIFAICTTFTGCSMDMAKTGTAETGTAQISTTETETAESAE